MSSYQIYKTNLGRWNSLKALNSYTDIHPGEFFPYIESYIDGCEAIKEPLAAKLLNECRDRKLQFLAGRLVQSTDLYCTALHYNELVHAELQ